VAASQKLAVLKHLTGWRTECDRNPEKEIVQLWPQPALYQRSPGLVETNQYTRQPAAESTTEDILSFSCSLTHLMHQSS